MSFRAPQIRNLLVGHGFVLDSDQVVVQLFARDLPEYCDRIAERALSSLQAISDSDFNRGLKALRTYCEDRPPSGPVHEAVDLFVLHK